MPPEAKFEVRILAPAQCDIERIALLHSDYVGVESARKVSTMLLNRIAILENHPYIGFKMPDEELAKLGYRGFLCERRYLCVYRPAGNKVLVHHIVDTRTDYQKLMKALLSAVDASIEDYQ